MPAMDAGLQIDRHATIQFADERLLGDAYPLLVGHLGRLGVVTEMRQHLGELLEHLHIDAHALIPLRCSVAPTWKRDGTHQIAWNSLPNGSQTSSSSTVRIWIARTV